MQFRSSRICTISLNERPTDNDLVNHESKLIVVMDGRDSGRIGELRADGDT